MADAESVADSGGTSSSSSSECRCNSQSEGSHCDTDDFDLRKSGWLMKRSVYSKKWKKKWFSLNGTELVYGEDAEMTKKYRVPLNGTAIANCQVDEKTNTFKLKPRGKRRTLIIQAENESDQQQWMEAICFAKAASHDKSNSTSCVIQ